VSKTKADKHNINADLAKLARPLKDLREDPKNARKHDERNIVAIASSLARFGQQKPIVITAEGVIIAGNGTYEAAKRMGWTHLAAVRFDKEAASEQLGYAITDNRSAELASWDDVILAEALKSLNETNDGSLADYGFEDAEFMKLVSKLEADADAEAKAAAESSENQPLGQNTPPAPHAGENVANSTVRMVQLFLTDQTHPTFVDRVKVLAAEYGTTNVTDTVFRAVEREFARSATQAQHAQAAEA
jgi:hypothetical protein